LPADKNMKKFLRVLSVLLCLLQFGCGFGKDIEGQVVDAQGNPVEGAVIKLVVWDSKKDDFPTKIIETTQTGKNGVFGVNIGEENSETKLMMDVEKDGYKLLTLRFTPLLVQKNGEMFKNYKIILEKK
jgi:hypothetical protein